MPKNQFQRMIFALITVIITVHGYVFYSLYVINGATLMEVTGADSVLHAIQAQGGVYMFGRMLPIWALILIEFCFAYVLECVLGSPCSFKLARVIPISELRRLFRLEIYSDKCENQRTGH